MNSKCKLSDPKNERLILSFFIVDSFEGYVHFRYFTSWMLAVISKSWMNWNSTNFFIRKKYKKYRNNHISACFGKYHMRNGSLRIWSNDNQKFTKWMIVHENDCLTYHQNKTLWKKNLDTQTNHKSCSYSDFCPFYQFIIRYMNYHE